MASHTQCDGSNNILEQYSRNAVMDWYSRRSHVLQDGLLANEMGRRAVHILHWLL